MSHFMTHQKVVYDPRSTVPDRQGQDTALDIKTCCRHLLVLNDEVLRCQQFGKSTFDFVVNGGHWFRFN